MKKILIVDDDTAIGEVLTEYLTEEGRYDVTFVPSAKEAVSLLEKGFYDLVITDMIMPEMNGIELTDYIFNNHQKVKVLACSGGGDSGKFVAGIALDQALQEGADNALLKPFSKEELISKVKSLIG